MGSAQFTLDNESSSEPTSLSGSFVLVPKVFLYFGYLFICVSSTFEDRAGASKRRETQECGWYLYPLSRCTTPPPWHMCAWPRLSKKRPSFSTETLCRDNWKPASLSLIWYYNRYKMNDIGVQCETLTVLEGNMYMHFPRSLIPQSKHCWEGGTDFPIASTGKVFQSAILEQGLFVHMAHLPSMSHQLPQAVENEEASILGHNKEK